MIYSASRRTDMPAFFPDMIVDRVKRSRKLEAMTIWTKDVGNLIRHPGLRDVLQRLPVIVNYTVTGLAGSVWEPGVRPLAEQLSEVAALGSILPRRAVMWRFDPIIATPDWRGRFLGVKRDLDAALDGVGQVTVSFPDPYRKAVERVEKAGLRWPDVPREERPGMLEFMAAAFPERGDGEAAVRLCCEPELPDVPGTGMARCVDGDAFFRLYGVDLRGLGKDAGQRAACGCVRSTDIGSYQLRCGHGCLYCYANPE